MGLRRGNNDVTAQDETQRRIREGEREGLTWFEIEDMQLELWRGRRVRAHPRRSSDKIKRRRRGRARVVWGSALDGWREDRREIATIREDLAERAGVAVLRGEPRADDVVGAAHDLQAVAGEVGVGLVGGEEEGLAWGQRDVVEEQLGQQQPDVAGVLLVQAPQPGGRGGEVPRRERLEEGEEGGRGKRGEGGEERAEGFRGRGCEEGAE